MSRESQSFIDLPRLSRRDAQSADAVAAARGRLCLRWRHARARAVDGAVRTPKCVNRAHARTTKRTGEERGVSRCTDACNQSHTPIHPAFAHSAPQAFAFAKHVRARARLTDTDAHQTNQGENYGSKACGGASAEA
eukprot:5310844-Pleurochrysis_carterae.AAC.1